MADIPQPFKGKYKKNSGSGLTRRKHTKIRRPGDVCINWETPSKSGRVGRYAVQRKMSNVNDSVGVKFLTRLCLGFNHLHEHKFRHGFRDILNLLCPCSIEAETTAHYFLRCHFYFANRYALMNKLSEIDSSFSTLNEDKFIDLILYGIDKFDDKKKCRILMCSIKFIISSQRFDENLP